MILQDQPSFWKQTDKSFSEWVDILKSNRYEKFIVYHDLKPFPFSMYTSQYKDELDLYYGDCIKISIRHDEAYLADFSTECEDAINGKVKVRKPTMYFLEFVDKITQLFWMRRIKLVDVATSKRKADIYMIMKHSQTFHERYNYTFCDTTIDYNLHKTLLRTFDFGAFYYLVDDKLLLDRRLAELGKSVTDYMYLHQFYVDSYEYLTNHNSENRIIALQKLLYDRAKPWYSMVHLLTSKKRCMQKTIN